MLIEKYDQRNFPACRIRLVPDVFIRAQKHIVTRFFYPLNQIAILQLALANQPSKCDFVAYQAPRNRLRRPVVE